MEISYFSVFITSILFVVILGIVVIFLISVRRYRKQHTQSSITPFKKEDNFLFYEQLYRKGKITKEEFEKIKSVILKREGLNISTQNEKS